MIRERVPGRLEYRDLAIRVVASACRLVPNVNDDFVHAVISATSEAFNNVVLHGYGCDIGDIEIEVAVGDDRLTICLLDWGRSLDLEAVPPPDLESLPQLGLGVFIMRAFMDHVSYAPGSPNRLSMTKLFAAKETRA